MGMIRSNAEKLVRDCTSSAIALLPDHHASDSDSDSFAKASLDALAPLRGVGIATASLILSIVTAAGDGEVPFYSDDSFLWLCAGRYPGLQGVKKYIKPNGDLNVKYNMNEYRMLWDAMLGLQGRLNADVKEGPRVGLVDVERVAYVLSHFDGVYEGEEVQGDEQGNKKQKRAKAKGEDL
jgi:ADA HAT complex component 1